MNEVLSSLLLDLTGLSDTEAEEVVFRTYVDLYLDTGAAPRRMGTISTHDGSCCTFTESRFEHAFYSKDRYTKDGFCKIRGVRVAWIGQLVAGAVDQTECWRIPPKGHSRSVRRPPNRLYLLRKESYVVWLEPGRNNKWWFSSAYIAGHRDIRRYCNTGTLIWQAQKISRD